jgi:hypothetical protein
MVADSNRNKAKSLRTNNQSSFPGIAEVGWKEIEGLFLDEPDNNSD